MLTDDLVELYLRRLASYVYGTRTGDWSGANYMLAVKAPGSEVDIAPDWLVTDATAFSKAEHQRATRVHEDSKCKGSGKGKDPKGKPKGGGRGSGTGPPTQG